MVFWSRIRPSKLQCLSNQCKRWYIQMPGDSSSVNCIAGLTRTSDLSSRSNSFNQWRPSELRETVRFFGALVRSKQKPERKDPTGPRLNDQITTQFVRLVEDEGHNVVSRHEALERARKLNLDLVEVQRTANPPVCKIMDFHKEKYKQQLKEKDRAKTKSDVSLRKGDCKEVRFSAKTEPRDLQIKADMVKRLMEKGYRVKCMVMGEVQKEKKDPKEQEEQEQKYKIFLGEQLSRLTDLIEEVSVVDSGPRVEKRQAFVIVRHIKFGSTKKGPGKKAAMVSESSITKVQQKAINSSNSESEYDNTLDEAETPFDTSVEINDEELTEKTWSTKDTDDNFGKMFSFDNNDTNSISGPNSPLEDASRSVSNGRSVPMSRSPLTGSTESASSDAKMPTEFSEFSSVQSRAAVTTNNGNLGSPSPDQLRQQQRDVTASIPTEQKPLRTDVSSFRNMKQPSITEPVKQQQSQPVTPCPPPKSYGIFSSQKPSVTSKQRVATEMFSEVKQGNSFDSTNRENSTSSTPNATSPNLNAENSRKPGSDDTREKKWGMFSRELSSANRKGTPESPGQVRR